MRLLINVLILTIVVLIQGCGTSDSSRNQQSGETAGSCVYIINALCTDFMGTSWSTSKAHHSCDYMRGKYYTSPCSILNRVGSCNIGAVTKDETIDRYYAPFYSEQFAQYECSTVAPVNGVPTTWAADPKNQSFMYFQLPSVNAHRPNSNRTPLLKQTHLSSGLKYKFLHRDTVCRDTVLTKPNELPISDKR